MVSMDETRYTKPLNSMDKTTNTTDSMNETINSVNTKDSMDETTEYMYKYSKQQGFYE